MRLVCCLFGIKRWEYEAAIETKAREKQLELMGALRVLIARDDSAIAWAKRKDALCFVKFVVDRFPTAVQEECVKTIRQRSMKREEVLLRALLELYQDMPLQIPTKELNDMDSYRRLEEVRRCSNEALTCDERVFGRNLESERVRDASKAEVLPIRVGCPENGL